MAGQVLDENRPQRPECQCTETGSRRGDVNPSAVFGAGSSNIGIFTHQESPKIRWSSWESPGVNAYDSISMAIFATSSRAFFWARGKVSFVSSLLI